MELIELFNLIKKNQVVFAGVFLLVFLSGLFFYHQQNQIYLASMAINISREKQNANQDYQYDQFYRLQADEKFGQNIVNWVGDSGLMNNSKEDFIALGKGNWEDISKVKAVQASSNYIKVEFKSKTPSSALVFGKVLKENLNKKNQQLGGDKEQNNWFKLIIDDTQVVKNKVNFPFFLITTILLAILMGIFGVLLAHYFDKASKN